MSNIIMTYAPVYDDADGEPTAWEARALSATGTELGSMHVRRFGKGDRLWIETVGVNDEYRNRGIGSALFTEVVKNNPGVGRYGAFAETPEGRVLLQSLKSRHYDLDIHFTVKPEGMGEPELRPE